MADDEAMATASSIDLSGHRRRDHPFDDAVKGVDQIPVDGRHRSDDANAGAIGRPIFSKEKISSKGIVDQKIVDRKIFRSRIGGLNPSQSNHYWPTKNCHIFSDCVRQETQSLPVGTTVVVTECPPFSSILATTSAWRAMFQFSFGFRKS